MPFCVVLLLEMFVCLFRVRMDEDLTCVIWIFGIYRFAWDGMMLVLITKTLKSFHEGVEQMEA